MKEKKVNEFGFFFFFFTFVLVSQICLNLKNKSETATCRGSGLISFPVNTRSQEGVKFTLIWVFFT